MQAAHCCTISVSAPPASLRLLDRSATGLTPHHLANHRLELQAQGFRNHRRTEQIADNRRQRFGEFDTKTSSWIETPADVRALGGALFGDRRYGKVFVYHNGAQSYYAARGFRGLLRV